MSKKTESTVNYASRLRCYALIHIDEFSNKKFLMNHDCVTILTIHPTFITATITDWWFRPTPLKNDGLRQLGLLLPIYPLAI